MNDSDFGSPADLLDMAVGAYEHTTQVSPSDECLALAEASRSMTPQDPALLAAFASEQADTRALAASLTVLAFGGTPPGFAFADMTVALGGRERIARLASIDIMSIGGPIMLSDLIAESIEVTDPLIRLLDDVDAGVRQRAAFALAVLGAPLDRVFAELERFVSREPSGVAAAGAVAGFAAFGNDRAHDFLLRTLRVDPDWRVRMAASWALSMSGTPSRLGFADVEGRVRAITMATSGYATDAALTADIVGTLRDEKAEPYLRIGAAEHLLGTGDPDLIRLTIEHLTRFSEAEEFAEHLPGISLLTTLAQEM